MTAPSDALPPAVSRAVIVGAGQAGLAVARALMERGLRPQEDFHIIDAGGPATLAWKRRWHSLTLFTPAWYSSLRGLKLPGDPGRYPRGAEIADYLDRYRDELGLIPSWNVTARSVGPDPHGHGLVLTTNIGQTWTRNVVAATGPFGAAQFPALAAAVRPPGVALHSGEYTHPNQVPRGSVLVVGAGSTGIQLARELSASHDVMISVGTQQRRLPQGVLGVDIFRWLTITGLLTTSATTPLGRKIAARDATVGPGIEDLRQQGVRVLPRAVAGHGGEVEFDDGSRMSPDSVVWATGYRSGFEWLPSMVTTGESASGLVHRGGSTPLKGLHVVGASWLRSRGSALIGGVSADAERVAQTIADSP